MKKLLLLIFIVAVGFIIGSNLFFLATFDLKGDYSVYTSSTPAEEYNLSFTNALFKTITEKESGTSIRFTGNTNDVDGFLSALKCKTVKTENVYGTEIIYAYSPLIHRSVTLEGKKVNIQIAKRGGDIIIGTPLIQGSY